jgi:hypothetical protein
MITDPVKSEIKTEDQVAKSAVEFKVIVPP